MKQKRGQLELANGGTVFLDEIGEMTNDVQAKLFTYLDKKTFKRLGGETNRTSDARIIAATNKDLKQAVKDGRFREELYYRLNVFSITVPPLRNRRDEIPRMIDEMLLQLVDEMKLLFVPHVKPDAMTKLLSYHWPGNIRELRNCLERALVLSRGIRIRAEHVEFDEEDDGELQKALYTDIKKELSESLARKKPVVAGARKKRHKCPPVEELLRVYEEDYKGQGMTYAIIHHRFCLQLVHSL